MLGQPLAKSHPETLGEVTHLQAEHLMHWNI
jgi:hypothetical protein